MRGSPWFARGAVMLLCATVVSSCHDTSPRDGERIAGSAVSCPPRQSVAAAGRVARAKYAPIELQLPATFGEARESRVEGLDLRGESWYGPPGVVVGYSVQPEPIRRRPFGADEQAVTCAEVIGGRPTELLLLYSESTIVPGQRVDASWELADGRTLRVHAFAYDSARKAELLEIVRSIRFMPDPS